ncbi:hypothetical protein I7I53_07026 [Histoplasma capsulatum var. duboisii H88]|uniref:Uncharacterized protein n=1 Tax=Ajellomyces capsulatus (strain H88) TaxID=544711 RepID=A0A8A1LGU3_AJEC8|nr:hypothetical protein I7I53_07026 [Histoplasma capsulatum var. duboisii H88]
MVSSGSLRVFDVLRELNRRRTIPSSYQKILEERLIITLKPLATRLERSKTRRPKEEYQERYKEKKAQKVYSEILEDYPHIFIPFILAIQFTCLFAKSKKQRIISRGISFGDSFHRMGDAIEKSQLREWEKSNSSHNTTDCVSIEIHPQQPHNSTFHLRVGFIAGTYIASKLYA